jgi:hypothetical protein
MKFAYLDTGAGVAPSIFQWARRLVNDLNATAYGGPGIGSALLYVGDIPANYLEADGSSFDPDQYPVLAAALGSDILPDWEAPAGGRYAIRAR